MLCLIFPLKRASCFLITYDSPLGHLVFYTPFFWEGPNGMVANDGCESDCHLLFQDGLIFSMVVPTQTQLNCLARCRSAETQGCFFDIHLDGLQPWKPITACGWVELTSKALPHSREMVTSSEVGTFRTCTPAPSWMGRTAAGRGRVERVGIV